MELTVREAATLLGRSPRAVRAQAARGELPAVKRGRQWLIVSEGVPLTPTQRRAVQARADSVRAVVEAALPGRDARSTGDRYRGLGDLEAFVLVRDAARGARALGAALPAELVPELEGA
ncbi:helix-turn-helix domain-containing protein [Myxococcota bacterium]|nr:helix-turn-helix domain-containing protein [Myxococcota bacterium]